MGLVDLRPQKRRRSPEDALRHLNSFSLDLKFSAGIWFFSPAASRFHDRYGPECSMAERLEIAASLQESGLAGLEAHYPSEINHDNLDLWKTFARDTGMRIVTVSPGLFWDREFEWGSLSSPVADARQLAIERTIEAFSLNRELDTDFAIHWPGIDGYEYPFGIDFVGMRDRYFDGLAEAMDAVPGVRLALEPKPYEPRGRILIGTTAEGMLACHEVEARLRNEENRRLLREGHALAAMNPELGHVLMGYEDAGASYSWPLSEGRLAHVHLNAQPLGNYDQDLTAGAVSPEVLEAMLYTLKMYGYQGWLGIDINPERMPVTTALRISMDAVRAADDRINGLDHEAMLYALSHPDQARGWMEAYLVRARAPHPDRLAPLPRPGARS